MNRNNCKEITPNPDGMVPGWMFKACQAELAGQEARALRAEAELATLRAKNLTPNPALPRLNPNPNRRKMIIEIEVGADFASRLDNQWEVEQEIRADRWLWDWKEKE